MSFSKNTLAYFAKILNEAIKSYSSGHLRVYVIKLFMVMINFVT